jgi:DNA modification methylase
VTAALTSVRPPGKSDLPLVGLDGLGSIPSTLYERLDVPRPRDVRLTHYLFRYPAKFHPPVVQELLRRFTRPGDQILDPFCGSGTLLVESAVLGRSALGIDVDPVAVEVSLAKTRHLDLHRVSHLAGLLAKRIQGIERSSAEYERRMFTDISERQFSRSVKADGLWVPEIPNLRHWFRQYVSIDLARILREIGELDATEDECRLFRVVFASILRNSSNADPVPVSGLEVTAHMKRKEEAGRLVNPPKLYNNALRKSVKAVAELGRARSSSSSTSQNAVVGDATSLPLGSNGVFDLVLTSPPYNNAVDYYRRHQLEMYWLGHTKTHDDRLALLPKYMGRHRVPMSHPMLRAEWSPGSAARNWEAEIRAKSPQRADDFRAYFSSMDRAFGELYRLTSKNAKVLMVVGQSTWNGARIPTEELLAETASSRFRLDEVLWYPVKNRYMSYARRNGADIDREFVLVFARIND